MTARAGMANLITRLRSMVSAGTADYSVSGATYWSDDQLQDRLDAQRYDLNDVHLSPRPEVIQQSGASSLGYYDYLVGCGDLEEAASGTLAWNVRDVNGATVGTANYSADYIRGVIRFNNDQMGSAYTLRARSFRLAQTAAAIWYEKAGQYPLAYDFSADGQSFSRSQMIDNALKMARSFDSASGITTSYFVRTDLNTDDYGY